MNENGQNRNTSAIVTGSSRGIGLAISEFLVSQGYKVIGISRTAPQSRSLTTSELYRHVHCDLSNTKKIESEVYNIINNEPPVKILVNNAGIGAFAPHEEIPVQDLERMLILNFVTPVLLTRLFLRDLKKNEGWIFQIHSVTALKESVRGAAYAGSKAGLRHFGLNLFEEIRKSGVKLISINPDVVDTEFYETLDFEKDPDPGSYLNVSDVLNAFEFAFSGKENSGFMEITVRPRYHKISKKPIQRKNRNSEAER
ncbi:SDR family oxidoreductase [Leptospira gomenensis]|uniref:SDR family oxidoreductase n=1 Tax=Leptospira gomenensis TaxID=2484974 RepID=A0A5F1YPZ8_9LEPT|nr:SDR family oxidoreductase [Leptospira gomenensis]TGK28231.1 SDR family oxidoreductase [Leptospira gomenensis]TGK37221.1 SDR family oxidoreductase [Leptospira gomenensis]TGK45888.1 SDR family oxidoreductase [Leptospira gomenensis]TGK59785.1 SDR family oxidoreductase [Leptospira gomenensis]